MAANRPLSQQKVPQNNNFYEPAHGQNILKLSDIFKLGERGDFFVWFILG